MAANIVSKKKCEYWDTCYRKSRQHREEFLHPEDETLKVHPTVKQGKPKPHGLTHDISIDENDVTPYQKQAMKRKNDKVEDDEQSSPTPQKKIKCDDSDEEKIAVNTIKTKEIETSSKAKPETNSSPTSSNDKISKPTQKKGKCKYWGKCYQKGGAHKKEFYHPGDDIPDENKNELDDGGTVDLESGYKLKRDGEVYSCTCKGFLIQRAPLNERTCRHLKEYLGEDNEHLRTKTNTKPKYHKAHISVSLMLAHKYEEKTHNPVGWWISEKLDGVRAYWNGKCFYSRLGNAFYAPEWFTKDLPQDFTLDGELFGGRGQFQSTVSIVKTAESPKWKDIKYYVFDSPDMGKETFENRMDTIKEYFEDIKPKYGVFVEQVKCKSKEHLEGQLTKILTAGGEGLMIRQPKSVYERTRSKTLLKIKKFYDAEAVVIGHEEGKGRNAGKCGALRCRMACGKEFSVGSGLTDKDRNRPPKKGSIITYKFQELSNSGSPRFPTYVGIRIDMSEPKDAEIRAVVADDQT